MELDYEPREKVFEGYVKRLAEAYQKPVEEILKLKIIKEYANTLCVDPGEIFK